MSVCRGVSAALAGLLADWSNSPSIICRSNYYSVSLVTFVVGLVVWCRCLRLLDWLVGAGVSAVGTTLLQSPGCNEGKARNETLGKHIQKRIELRRSGTFSASICRGVVPPLQGSINVFLRLTQGLRPGLCRSIALAGLFADWPNSPSIICRSNYYSVSLFALVVGFIVGCWRECRPCRAQ